MGPHIKGFGEENLDGERAQCVVRACIYASNYGVGEYASAVDISIPF